jgi:hypothetical protein
MKPVRIEQQAAERMLGDSQELFSLFSASPAELRRRIVKSSALYRFSPGAWSL